MLAPCSQDDVDLGPEVREKRCGIHVGVEADAFPRVFVVELDAGLGSGSGVFANGVSVIESKKPLAVLVVQR
jgi:hypothetical protein